MGDSGVQRRYPRWLVWLLLFISLAVLFAQAPRLTALFAEATDDFVQYWAAGRLLIAGENPYEPAALLPLQQEAGRPRDYPLLMYNPPWALTLTLWTALFDYPTARTLWFLLSLLLILLSADLVWRLYSQRPEKRWLAWLVSLIFMPALLALDMGQIGPLALLGLAGFLYFAQERRWFAAGVCLMLAGVKPQLLYLVWAALILWFAQRRQWRLLLSGGLAGAAAMAAPLILNPALICHYLTLTRDYSPLVIWAPPTWGTVMRLWLGVELTWLQYAPSLAGLFWLFFYWRRHGHAWQWSEHLPLLLLVSLLTTSYGWLHDQIVLVIPLLQVVAWLTHEPRSGKALVVILLFLLTNGLILYGNIAGIGGIVDVWTFVAWLLLYLLATKLLSLPTASLLPEASGGYSDD